jgi:hypothetical protein
MTDRYGTVGQGSDYLPWVCGRCAMANDAENEFCAGCGNDGRAAGVVADGVLTRCDGDLGVGELPVPDMPEIRSNEQYANFPFPLVDGIPLTLGWQWMPGKKGGPCFALIRRGALVC